jgi:Tol biopolymer transport system component
MANCYLLIALLAISAGIAGCGSGSTATPGPTPNPVPAVNSVSPNSAPAGALAFTLTVSGSNFLPASQVQWNGSSRTTTFVSSAQLQAHIMAADVAAAGKVPITVLNPAPGGGSSNAVTFTVPALTIAFLSERALDGSDALNTNSTENIWVMNPDGTSPAPLTRLTMTGPGNPAWSPDGSKIAYESTRALDGSDGINTNATSNIWVMNADGSNPKPLTRVTALDGGSFQPAWSRDGNKIVFDSERALDGTDNSSHTLNIWMVNADGSGAIPLTKLTTTAVGDITSFPAFSPDGSKIAFQSGQALDGSDAGNSNATGNIWVMNVDGSGAKPLTRLMAANADSENPVWSADGSKIAFISSRALDASDAANSNHTRNIWTINPDGSGAAPVTRLTTSGTDSFNPVWSPDGGKLSFQSPRALDGSDAVNTNHTFNIWTVHTDGSNPIPLSKLTATGSNSTGTKWFPDGSKVIFVSRRALDGSDAANTNSTANIWVVNADGSGATPLTKLTKATSESPGIP